jgi:hypothetical protein
MLHGEDGVWFNLDYFTHLASVSKVVAAFALLFVGGRIVSGAGLAPEIPMAKSDESGFAGDHKAFAKTHENDDSQ